MHAVPGDRIARLIRAGVLRAPLKPLDVEAFLKLPRMEDPEGFLLKAVLEERGYDIDWNEPIAEVVERMAREDREALPKLAERP